MFDVYESWFIEDAPGLNCPLAVDCERETRKTIIMKRLLLLLALTTLCALNLTAADELERGFTHPPDSARPWVYWFWLNGNITSNGISADLEAMKRVGVGGVLIMEVDQGAPVGPVDFMGGQWRELFKHVAGEARRLGLEVNMNNDAGWNGSGGPWIKPEQSMQKVVWTETDVSGPKSFEGTLARPGTVTGFYQDITVLAFPRVGAHRIAGMRQKALFETGFVDVPAGQDLPAEMVIDRSRIVDLSGRLGADGHLQWDVPEGQWTVLRLGHTSTGVENAPSPKTGRGLECDKLSREGIEANFAGMMAKLVGDTQVKGRGATAGLVATHIDSWENGAQNWTAKMREEFQQRRGYDLLPFLAVITGRVVESAEVSERFLWDLRQTISDLVVENYAGHMRELANAAGLRFTVEAYGAPCDSIPYGGMSDEPMGEFWSPSGAMETCKGMASAGHVYGHRIIGAESFTAADQEKWREHPGSIKALGDVAFCEGINRFVFHRYALQPWAEDRRPGMMMGPWGQHYERTETWWEQTVEWHRYLARCQFLLRQGLFVADICYVSAERPPQSFEQRPRLGYDYDECDSRVVLNRMSVKNGLIMLPDGMSYRLLVLPQTGQMTPRLLRRIKALAEAGATIVGSPPQKSPSLSGFPDCDREVKELAGQIWGTGESAPAAERRLGSGRVFRQREPEKVLGEMGVAPDFVSGEPLRCIHRRAGDANIYFVANRAPRSVSTTCAFRVTGKVPEFWWPDTGVVERAAAFQESDGRTSVGLRLGPSGSVFVVFRRPLDKAIAATRLVHGDELVLSTKLGSQPQVRVERATYGVPGSPDRTRDVRQKVQAKVDAGERSFQVASLAEGDDPAPQVLKTLVVDYTIGGQHYTVKGTDPATLRLTADAVKVQVEKARYGVLDDPKRTRDVRDKLQRLLDAGETSFAVARMAEGDDPAVMVVKTLEVEYSIDGKHLTAHGTDPEIVELAPPAPERELVAGLHATNDRQLTLDAFQPGRYEVELGDGKSRQLTATDIPQAHEVVGPWSVRFDPKWGGPAQATFEKLVPWNRHTDPGIKYYSGTAVYSAAFELPRELVKGKHRVYLDLGRVEVMAEVKVNGKRFPLLWKPPYRLDVTGAARAGRNTLDVAVINLWPNRLIGDEQLPEDSERNPDGTLKRWPQWLLDGKPSPTGRYTFPMWRLWKKKDALLDSGLIGPVKLIPSQEVEIRQ
jgi:hypothetical protein